MQAPVSAGELLRRAVHRETVHHPVVPVPERPWITQVREAKHVVVFTGAGISTSVGIPDFRCSPTSHCLHTRGGRHERNQHCPCLQGSLRSLDPQESRQTSPSVQDKIRYSYPEPHPPGKPGGLFTCKAGSPHHG